MKLTTTAGVLVAMCCLAFWVLHDGRDQAGGCKGIKVWGPLPPAVTSFFGDDASKLQPGPEGGAALVYINQSAQWSKYAKIQPMPVEF